MIRWQIDNLTLCQIGIHKKKIEDAIEFMYWQGSLSRRKYEKMNELLSNKYAEIMNKHDEEISRKMDTEYFAMLKHYGLENDTRYNTDTR